MTAATGDWELPATPTPARRVPVQPVTARRVLRSEWIKISTLRSSWLVLALAVLGTIAVGAVASWADAAHFADMRSFELEHFNAVDDSLTGVQLAQLAIGVLGVLVVTGEYSTGMIRSSLAAAPRRLPVLAAKIAVLAAGTAIAMAVTAFVAFFLGQAFLGVHGVSITSSGALRAILGADAYLIAVAIMAVAIGFIVRSTAGGIATLVALLLLLPAIGGALPDTWQQHLMPYLPSNAGAALYSINTDQVAPLSPVAALVTLGVWCAVAVVLAARVLRRRDA